MSDVKLVPHFYENLFMKKHQWHSTIAQGQINLLTLAHCSTCFVNTNVIFLIERRKIIKYFGD